MKKFFLKLFYKIYYKYIDIHNARVERIMDDYYFLRSLCIEDRSLNLNKYCRLMDMVKRKYRR